MKIDPSGREQNGDEADLQELLEEIQSITHDSNWELEFNQLSCHVHFEMSEFYRYIYSQGISSGDLFAASPRVGPDNFNYLIEYLSNQGYRSAPDLFYRAGYYFNSEKLDEWMELFISVTLSKIQNHQVDREILENSLAGCLDYQDGFRFYQETEFTLQEHIDFALSIYFKHYRVDEHSYSRSLLEKHIRHLFHQRILKEEFLYQSFYERLFKKCLKWHLLSVNEVEPELIIEQDEKLLRAMTFLGLSKGKPLTAANLKKRYRELVKQFHPDRNPEGLEKCRELNEAYALILSKITNSSKI